MGKIKAHLDNVALSHSIFALPFAYMGTFLAAGGWPPLHSLIWVTAAMVGARSAALALNNLIDLKYDRQHPRFTQRPMVTGAIKPWEAALFILGSLAVFLAAAVQLHPLCVKLAPLAILPFVVYPYMKRFSWACHLVLGLALAVAPVGGYVAIQGEITLGIVLLAGAVGIWIAAFDVIYGCQDVAVDTQLGLNSMPVRFGVPGALRLARWMHSLSIVLFVAVGAVFHLALFYYIGVMLAAAVLVYQHSIVSPADLSRVKQSYFLRNGLVGMAVFGFTVISIL